MQPNINNRTMFIGDNLKFLTQINSECVDLICTDPPFNKKKEFTAPIGSAAEGARFLDRFAAEDVKEEWVNKIRNEHFELHSLLAGIKAMGNQYNYCYLVYMAMRILECHRILKNTGSFYLHCDHTMAHYLKLLLDCIFGEKNFRNEIIWCYTSPGRAVNHFPRKHDTLLFYAKSDAAKFHSDAVRIAYADATTFRLNAGGKFGGKMDDAATARRLQKGKVVESWWTDIEPMLRRPSERTGWPTQKPLALYERIIQASSNKGDLVLDPFCGCATTCIAAERLERNWAGIDVAIESWKQIETRLKKEVPADLIRGEAMLLRDPPVRD